MIEFPPAAVGFGAWLLWAALLVALLFAARFYGTKLRAVLEGRGLVNISFFLPADFGVAAMLATWLILLVTGSGEGASPPVQESDLLSGALIFLAIVAAIFARFWVRHVSPLDLFGFRLALPRSLAGKSLVFLLAALPLIQLITALTSAVRGLPDQPQDIVKYFRESVSGMNYRAVMLTSFYATIVAPFCEETVFRGYLYGAFKRFAGAPFALLATSGIFASIHLSADAFGPLFVLALCLALAYEATGSLAVPMVMHAIFNAGNLAVMYAFSRAHGG